MKEINRYRLALVQYYLSYILPKWIFATDLGFCYHFSDRHGFLDFQSKLPILYSLRTKSKGWENYWFPAGDLKPRINLLHQAIKIAKNKSLKNNLYKFSIYIYK